MRTRNLKNKKEILDNCNFLINNPEKYQGKYQELFNNKNEIHVELGMGKGKFIYEMALKYPNINFIGIERFDSILASAIKSLSYLPNLKLIRIDGNKIDEIFSKEISVLYLNFVDPWPKKRHARRRLTDISFLKKYDLIFKNNCHIKLKTDNNLLFESSVISLSDYHYVIKDFSLDLASKEMENVLTEYEIKFMNKDTPIKYLEAIK